MVAMVGLPENKVVRPTELDRHRECTCKSDGICSGQTPARPIPNLETMPLALLNALHAARRSGTVRKGTETRELAVEPSEVVVSHNVPINVAADYLSTFMESTEEIYIVQQEVEAVLSIESRVSDLFISARTRVEIDEQFIDEVQVVGIETGLEIVGSSIPALARQSRTIAGSLSLDGGVAPPDPPAPRPANPSDLAPTCEIHEPRLNHDGPRRIPVEPGKPPRFLEGSLSPDTGRPWWEGRSGGEQESFAPPVPTAFISAAPFELKPPPAPYCPKGYSFDFQWQSCWPNGIPHRSPSPGDVHAHACRCPTGHSWLVDTDRCWERGQVRARRFGGARDFDVDPTQPPPLVRFDPGNFNDWHYRRKKRGSGRCTGSTNDAVRTAFRRAYEMCRAAQLELDYIASRTSLSERQFLWGAAVNAELHASWEYWFGDGYATYIDLDTRIHFLRDYISGWSQAFRSGFYKTNNHPVYIRCKSRKCVGGGTKARHLVRNTVELCDGTYFDLVPDQRAITMLHEMGHFSGGNSTTPRDERNGTFCEGGWNVAENMCYRSTLIDVVGAPSRFTGGNPKILADASSGFSDDAFYTMVNNVDNYVCLMWNRWQDRQDQRFDL